MRYLAYLVLVLLLVLNSALGVVIYNKYTAKKIALSPTPQPSKNRPLFKYSDDKSLLEFPYGSFTEEEYSNFIDGVRLYAKETDVVTLSKCQALPIVAKIEAGKEIKFNNIDSVDFQLVGFYVKTIVPAKTTKSIKIGSRIGTFTYQCSSSDIKSLVQVGILYVVQ